MQIASWMVTGVGAPMVWQTREQAPGPGQVLVEVAGCGVCHTDLGYYYDGVPTRHALPLTLGHEVSGRVVATGPDTGSWMGQAVIVPAVIPCGSCPACAAGRGMICPKQMFPGNDDHGGFGTHVCVPARGLCPVPDLSDRGTNPRGLDLASLSVIADAVSTPYQAIHKSGLEAGDLAVFVGVGGVGGFGVQLAVARGAHVAAIDVDAGRLARMEALGACATFDASRLEFKDIKSALRDLAKAKGVPTFRQVLFETSGTPQGQTTAFGLLGHGGTMIVVGFTPAKVELRLSNLMAFDARIVGTWGCLPEHYPAVLRMVLAGQVDVAGSVEHRPLSSIQQVFTDLHERRLSRRVVLTPEV